MNAIARLLLVRSGRLSVATGTAHNGAHVMQALDVELAALGFMADNKLRTALATLPEAELASTFEFMRASLADHIGAGVTHLPVFASFPRGIPTNMNEHWRKRFLGFMQFSADEDCPRCGCSGTGHVIEPCGHVACEHCFNGSKLNVCPVCERQADLSSQFHSGRRPHRSLSQRENVKLKVLTLGAGEAVEARRMFESLCARTQALSPDDREFLTTIVTETGAEVLGWLPEKIPLKENIAVIIGELLKSVAPDAVLEAAGAHVKTATDLLRVIAVFSGSDASLQAQPVVEKVGRWQTRTKMVKVFKLAKINRPLRRAILGFLEKAPFERLVEDMKRHESKWVFVGELLHPFEYATRFPKAAAAFAVIRNLQLQADTLGMLVRAIAQENHVFTGDDGTVEFQTFNAKLEEQADLGDGVAFTRLLRDRPGELARRLDHALRLVLSAGQSPEPVIQAFSAGVKEMGTPVLATLRNLLPTRTSKAPVRMFWPKGEIAKGVSVEDERETLPEDVVAELVPVVENELLRRFAEKPRFVDGVLDSALASVVAPFNERTASRSSVALPRGSRVKLPEGEFLRLFMHWCQPAGGHRTDLDMSISFHDANMEYLGACSWSALTFPGEPYQRRINYGGWRDGMENPSAPKEYFGKSTIARSAGDRTDAPHPDGASEFVDLHVERARKAGIRYAVMVVNAWSGLSFSQLERAFAGIMQRTDEFGAHFDPRTVTMKFDLQGENGVFLPMVVDLEKGEMHWVDMYQKGRDFGNSAWSSADGVGKTIPEFMAYFASGARPSVYDLGLLHAASRCENVYLRGSDGVQRFSKRANEDVRGFYDRIVAGKSDESLTALPRLVGDVFSCLYHGDVDLPGENNTSYALFREKEAAGIAASDLLS